MDANGDLSGHVLDEQHCCPSHVRPRNFAFHEHVFGEPLNVDARWSADSPVSQVGAYVAVRCPHDRSAHAVRTPDRGDRVMTKTKLRTETLRTQRGGAASLRQSSPSPYATSSPTVGCTSRAKSS